MRQDAQSLLKRLGRTEFRYQEFEDPFADMELWPIFEALLRDADVVGHQAPELRNTEVQFRSTRPVEPAADEAAGTLFSLYGAHAAPAGPPAAQPVNLRRFFERFAEGE